MNMHSVTFSQTSNEYLKTDQLFCSQDQIVLDAFLFSSALRRMLNKRLMGHLSVYVIRGVSSRFFSASRRDETQRTLQGQADVI